MSKVRWSPDTCGCVIDIEQKDNSTKYIDWVEKCFGHKDLEGQALVNAAVTQCKKFQISIQDQKSKKKRNANMKEKRDERERIAKQGPVTKNKLIRNTLR